MENTSPVPNLLRTERLLLRRWELEDAARLVPVLEANASRLEGWIPRRAATPAAPLEVAERLAGFAADFDAGRTWRYALFSPDGQEVLGEVSLHPRDASGRVPLAAADRLEIGYWLRADATGKGLATEAARAMLGLAATVPGMTRVEIRCDVHNERSAAVPRRLGFRLADIVEYAPVEPGAAPVQDMVWEYELPAPRRGGDA